ERRRLADNIGANALITGQVEIDGLGAPQGVGFALGIALGLQHTESGQAIQSPGIQMGKAIVPGQLLGQGALAACGSAINGDDDTHAVSITAPRPAIKSRYSGKEVAIMVTSSTLTGWREAKPMVKKLMAMR